MIDIKANLEKIYSLLPSDVQLVAVSKFHSEEDIITAFNAGQKTFGESRVQEFLHKYDNLPKDIDWHFIGHLQTNKVKPLIGKTKLIESVDSEKLLNLIDKESFAAGIITNVLLQVHVAEEETKFGFYPDELLSFFNEHKYENLKSTHICGIMGMATNTDDETRIRDDFKTIHKLFNSIRNNQEYSLRGFDKLSMGMSGDWKIAIEEGSNIVRIGSAIFGERIYN